MKDAVSPGTGFGRIAQERAVAEVEAELGRLCERLAEGRAMGLDDGREMVGGAMAESLVQFFAIARMKGSGAGLRGMVALPLLVHGAETGDPDTARPVAVLHVLWWAAARQLDDLTDVPAASACRIAAGKKALAALAVGGQLPARLAAGLPVGDGVRARLADEVSRAWLDAVDGQLRDLSQSTSTATPASVLHSYAGKTGAPYAMAAAAAASLAGADPDRTDAWRDCGRALGVLRQLVNDRHDLVSGRHEDFANGTATHLLVHLLASLPADRRRETLALHTAARTSACARAELMERMFADEVVASYAASVRPLIERAHGRVDALGGEPGFARELHRLVDETAAHLPGPRPVPA